MNLEQISPDQVIFFTHGVFVLNATILFTWVLIFLMVLASWLVTRNLQRKTTIPRWQNFLEVIVETIKGQIASVSSQKAERYIPFIGTLFLFIFISNFLMIVPGFVPPTASLSTTTALAICVFVSVPIFGVATEGLKGYFSHYIRPTPLMMPFHIIGEFSRTLALAVRLFGNVMSGTKIVAILVAIAPLFFPILMNALGLLTGIIQAYIFAILAIVYIASASETHQSRENKNTSGQMKEEGKPNG